MPEDKSKQKALELAIGSIEKEFGRGSIMRLADGQKIGGEVTAVSTGSLGLDVCLGIGGYPRGRIIEIYGPESSGKTTLTLHAISSIQKQGGVAAFIDAEHALDVTYARRLGVKTEELLISQPDYGEQALEIADMLVSSNAVDIVIVDSVAALVPKAEIEGEMGDSHVGLQARLMSQALRKLTGTVARSKCVLMFTNQIRMKIGVMFGSPETTTGGNALKFYASQRLDIRRIGAIKEASKDKKGEMAVVGNRTRVKVVKNKMAPPFREAEFDIFYGKGVSRSGEVVDMAVDLNFIQKSGAWYSVGPERIGQGRENARAYLEEHPELMAKLEGQILAHNGIGGAAAGIGGAAAGIGPNGSVSNGVAGGGTSGGGESGKEGGKGESSHASGTYAAASASASSRRVSADDDEEDEGSSRGRPLKAAAAGGSKAAPVAAPAKRPGARAN
ncbi:MAG TPA: recombinase RecA [Polyangiaceae bacterium]|nr:recombinase RecA [Polyangiaceae bacterium]